MTELITPLMNEEGKVLTLADELLPPTIAKIDELLALVKLQAEGAAQDKKLFSQFMQEEAKLLQAMNKTLTDMNTILKFHFVR